MVIIKNSENNLLASVILDELSNTFSNVIPKNDIKIAKTVLDNTKGEINLFLQLLTDLSISIIASMAYDFIKMFIQSKLKLMKNSLNQNEVKLTLESNENIKTISIIYNQLTDEIDITIK